MGVATWHGSIEADIRSMRGRTFELEKRVNELEKGAVSARDSNKGAMFRKIEVTSHVPPIPIDPCPRCYLAGSGLIVIKLANLIYVECPHCTMVGPPGICIEEAIELWRTHKRGGAPQS